MLLLSNLFPFNFQFIISSNLSKFFHLLLPSFPFKRRMFYSTKFGKKLYWVLNWLLRSRFSSQSLITMQWSGEKCIVYSTEKSVYNSSTNESTLDSLLDYASGFCLTIVNVCSFEKIFVGKLWKCVSRTYFAFLTYLVGCISPRF